MTLLRSTLFSCIAFGMCGYASLEECYRPLKAKLGSSGMRNIDYIYLINLDERPERWERCMAQLLPYGIIPERYPGIYGWTLSPEILNKIGLQFLPGMWSGREAVCHFPLDGDGTAQWVWISEEFYGKSCFSTWTFKGGFGCLLSHLSVLKDAYDSGYKTIWILEDDMIVRSDPHQLSALIEELDLLVGSDRWDVLYTDLNFLVVDPAQEASHGIRLANGIPIFFWRPDMGDQDLRFLAKHVEVGEHFIKIGSRIRQHSVIYRRSGIEKIVDFYRDHGNFLPFDVEIALIPGIQLYTLKWDLVSVNEVTSDTRIHHFRR